MIKNPTTNQPIFYLSDENEVLKGVVSRVFYFEVELSSKKLLDKENIYPTEKLSIQHALKSLNKQIFTLSKKREKLATKMAKMLK